MAAHLLDKENFLNAIKADVGKMLPAEKLDRYLNILKSMFILRTYSG